MHSHNNIFEIIKTKDGSDTVYSKVFNATYHSVHGALQESQHVYIKNGFLSASHQFDEVHILEVGFGTGLNACLTLNTNCNKHVFYHGVEKHPLPKEIYTSLNYQGKQYDTTMLHECSWNIEHHLTPTFHFTKINGDINTIHFSKNYNLVYYDAFAPAAQSDLWNKVLLEKIINSMFSKGIIVTFCAKGEFKRTLKSLGLIVETLPGPSGKREMTRAIKP